MEQRLKSYLKYTDELLKEKNSSTKEWKQRKEEHLVQISFFQHERLVHLIVTVIFALLEMLSLMMIVFHFSMMLLALSILLLILLIPYIRHYYILENGVQKMYNQYDEFLKKENTKKK